MNKGTVMISSFRPRSNRVRSTALSPKYMPGSFCMVLSPAEADRLVQFYALLLRIHHRMSQQQSNREQSKKYTISKTKGSHISGPFVLLILKIFKSFLSQDKHSSYTSSSICFNDKFNF